MTRNVVGTRRASFSGVPRWVIVIAIIGAAFVLLPLVAMASRVNWGGFVALVSSESSVAALGLSPGLPVWFTLPETEVSIYALGV